MNEVRACSASKIEAENIAFILLVHYGVLREEELSDLRYNEVTDLVERLGQVGPRNWSRSGPAGATARPTARRRAAVGWSSPFWLAIQAASQSLLYISHRLIKTGSVYNSGSFLSESQLILL